MKNIFPRTSFEYSDDNLKEINDILRNSKRNSSRFENQTRYRSIYIRASIYKELIYPPKILSLFYSRRGNFILRSNPRPLLSLPNPILIRPSTIHYDNKAASENPSLEPPPLHPLETWQIQNLLRLTVHLPGTPSPKKRPLFRGPPISSLSFPFFSSPPSLSSQLAALYNRVVKGTPLVAQGGLTFRACRTCFGLSSHRFHASFAIG